MTLTESAIKTNNNATFRYHSNVSRSCVKPHPCKISVLPATANYYTPPGGKRFLFVITEINITTYSEGANTQLV
ncbi:hypothetical protein G6F56_005045 [Rhizopus delemar]|nr:hypothetical protein G6F56_005045 [Rhizopus delemar]